MTIQFQETSLPHNGLQNPAASPITSTSVQESYRAIFELTNDFAYEVRVEADGTLAVAWINAGTQQLTGYSVAELQAPDFWQKVVHPEDRQIIWLHAHRILAGQPDTAETRIITQSGAVRWLRFSAYPIWDATHGRVVRYVGGGQDITDRKRTQEVLSLFRSVIDHINDGIEIIDPQTERFLDVNEQACRAHGYTRAEYLALTVADIDPLIAAGSWSQTWGDAPWTGPRIFESQHRRKDGSLFPVEININYVQADRGYMIALVRDITERKAAESVLKESEERYRTLFEDNPSMYFILAADGTVAAVNRFGAEHLGYTVSDLLGQSVLNVFYAEDKAAALQAVHQCIAYPGELFRWSLRKVRKDGTIMWVEETARAMRRADGSIQVLIVCEDISELKRLEEQFRQAQKMEAVGQLAGGVAHDFNNLLMVINGYSMLVFDGLPTDDPNRKRLAEIQKAGDRAATLTRQLLAFSRKQVLQPQVVNLNTLLSELLNLLRRLIGEDIELTLTPGAAVGQVKVDPGQFEQAIVNLAVNARDAMPQGGRLRIQTAAVALDQHFVQFYPEVKPGWYVQVTVSDSGVGMDEATKTHIFEPFFTTKAVGKGTGLGLAMVYGFVKQSDGHIEVESEPGRGTTFTIYLPRVEQLPGFVTPLPELLEGHAGTETILLVEDEEAVRHFFRQTLQASGYTVLEACDGQEALFVARQYPDPIHILVTDLVMPRLSGRQLADTLLQSRPTIRSIFISGYTDEAVVRHGVTEGSVILLQKPFAPLELLKKIREVLTADKVKG